MTSARIHTSEKVQPSIGWTSTKTQHFTSLDLAVRKYKQLMNDKGKIYKLIVLEVDSFGNEEDMMIVGIPKTVRSDGTLVLGQYKCLYADRHLRE